MASVAPRTRSVALVAAVALVAVLPSAAASPTQAGKALIAYERWIGDGSPDHEIWVMEADGSRQRKLVGGCCLAWSPDGRAIAFHTEGGISRIDVDGTHLRRLAARSTHYRPAWSPDGKRIVYAEEDGLFVVASSGGSPTRLTRGNEYHPAWSPNGRKIVFERFLFRPGANGSAIFVVNADGSGERQLTDLGSYSPAWSPGGKKIAYIGWESELEQGLYVMNADGSEQTLVGPGKFSPETPSWSPGGKRIAFLSGRAIHTVRPDGRRHKRVARGHNDEPQWSPDGRSIVFRGRARNQYDIYVMLASGANATNVTDTPRPVLEASPAWSPTRP